MSAYATASEEGAVKMISKDAIGIEQVFTLCYTEVLRNHYQYWHVVDNNNSNCIQPILIDEPWKMGYWPN
jgi:hypothetical protein